MLSEIPSERLPSMPSAAVAADCTYQEHHSEQCDKLVTVFLYEENKAIGQFNLKG